MPRLSRLSCLLFAVLAVSLGATALPSGAPATETARYKQVPLTRDMVTRMLAAFPELKALSGRYAREAPAAADGDKGPVGALPGFLKYQAARAEVEAVLARHGFSGFPEWLDVARSVALAYGYVKSGKTPEELGGQAEEALAAIRSNPRLSAAQKAEMEALVKKQLGALKQYEPLPQNLELAGEMRVEIGAVIDRD